MRNYQKFFCQTAECTKNTKIQTNLAPQKIPTVINFIYYPHNNLEIEYVELCGYIIKLLLKTIIFPGSHDMWKYLF